VLALFLEFKDSSIVIGICKVDYSQAQLNFAREDSAKLRSSLCAKNGELK
jgi:hypothetical protein